MGKAHRREANTGGSPMRSLATTSLLSTIPLKFFQVNSQARKNMGSCWHGFCFFCQHYSKDSLEGEDYRTDSPGNEKADWIVASEWQHRIN